MLSVGGFESLTCHKTIHDLCLFINHLAASLNEKSTVSFELSRFEEIVTEHPYESDFSGWF